MFFSLYVLPALCVALIGAAIVVWRVRARVGDPSETTLLVWSAGLMTFGLFMVLAFVLSLVADRIIR